MGRPSTVTAVALVASLLSLQLLLLPAPASSAAAGAGAAARAIGRSPLVKKVITGLLSRPARQGTAALIKAARARNRNNDQLGSAAADNAGFVVYNVSIGTQQTVISGIVDITFELVWTQCDPCTVCLRPQVPTFHPTDSASFSKVSCASQTCQSALSSNDTCGTGNGADDCQYIVTYSDAYNASGYLANETFTTDGTAVTGRIVFGCSNNIMIPLDGESGVIGFTKGDLSLVSQLNISRFSYYLAPDDSDTSESVSVVLLGDQAVPQTKRSSSTPLLRSNMNPDLYYVKLTGIQVDGQALSGIPAGAFDLRADGSGGVVLSTLSQVTYLQVDAYNAVRQALESRIQSKAVDRGSVLDGFDLCYTTQSVASLKIPRLTLLFDGAAMELTTVNYFYKDNATGLQCLTMLPMPGDAPVGSMLGNLVQTGTNMIYDINGGRLTFEKAKAPAPSQVSLMIIAPLLLVWVLLF